MFSDWKNKRPEYTPLRCLIFPFSNASRMKGPQVRTLIWS